MTFSPVSASSSPMLALQMFASSPSESAARLRAGQDPWSMPDPVSPSRSRSLSLRRQPVDDDHASACRDSGYGSSSNTPVSKPDGRGRQRQSSTGEAVSSQRTGSTTVPSAALRKPDCIETDVSKRWFGQRRIQLNVYERDIPRSVRARYEDLRELLTRGLHEDVLSSRSRDRPGNVGMKLKILGETEDTAKPYIVVLCDAPLIKELSIASSPNRTSKPDTTNWPFRLARSPLDLQYAPCRLSSAQRRILTYCGRKRRLG